MAVHKLLLLHITPFSGGEGVHLWVSNEQQSLPTHRLFGQHSGTLGHQKQKHQQDSRGREESEQLCMLMGEASGALLAHDIVG